MANEEQLERLRQGVEGWNRWMLENRGLEIDLDEADLRGAKLNGAFLVRVDLREADLVGANLMGAYLSGANLMGAHLEGADLFEADLVDANLFEADLRGAHLGGASLGVARLQSTNLRRADLAGAMLSGTVLGNVDLSETKSLNEVEHLSPSPISTSTLELSKGSIPEKFLKGCGLSDWEIESAKLYQPGLSSKEVNDILYLIHDLRVSRATQVNPLFISYSHVDSAFVDEMEKHLDERGIRFWRDVHDATAGRLEKMVDRAMRLNPTVLLILSGASVQSDWVEHEARTARELEKELGRDVLCPVALDDAWKTCKWPARLREQIMEYNILDFSKWEDKDEFGKVFWKLIDGLDLFYKE